MKIFYKKILLFTGLALLFFSGKLFAQDSLPSSHKKLNLGKYVQIHGQMYLAGQYRNDGTQENFAFSVRRAYMTVEATLTKNLSIRYTQDITIDDEGDDAGNIELRIKYLYVQYKIPAFWIFSHNRFKFGIVQRPWLDFEEHVNAYRVQGPMFMERSGLFNSSGFGLSYQGFFGGKLSGGYADRVQPHFPGKYGSFALGLYNGGGYHQFERNLGKNFEVRVTLRPFPGYLPGLQFSYLGLFGTGNIPEKPPFRLNAGMISYECRYATLTAQYEGGIGNSFGTYVDSTFSALPHHGYSLYAEFKIPKTSFAVYGRYDHFLIAAPREAVLSRRQIYGASWRFFRQNKLVFSYQYGNPVWGKQNISIYDLAVDVSF